MLFRSTKDQIKLLCEDNPQLQWWAMILFAEISDLLHGQLNANDDIKMLANYVKAKVEEFPRLVIHESLNAAKLRLEEEQKKGEEDNER